MSLISDIKLNELFRGKDNEESSHRRPRKSFDCHFAAHGKYLVSLQHGWEITLDDTIDSFSSSADGSLVVVISVIGIFSLVRGLDGQVVETRSTGFTTCSAMTWIDGCNINKEFADESHTLLLVNTSNIDVTERASLETSLTLIRNLSANHLARHPVSIKSVKVDGHHLAECFGKFTSDGNLRLVSCSVDEEMLIILNWNIIDDTFTIDGAGATLLPPVDVRVGLVSFNVRNQSYFMCSTFAENVLSLNWLYEDSLESNCCYLLPQKCRLMSAELLKTKNEDPVFAVAIASLPSASDLTPLLHIQVVQVIAEDIVGLMTLSKPHVLYSIPLNRACRMVEFAASTTTPLQFHFKVWTDKQATADYRMFFPNQGFARLKRLMEKGDMDAAENLFLHDGEMFASDYAVFSWIEIPYQRFKNLVNQTEKSSLATKHIDTIHQILDQLTDELECGDPRALNYLLDSVHLLTNLSGESTMEENGWLLSLLASVVDRVLSRFAHREDVLTKQDLSSELAEIQNRVEAQQAIACLIQNATSASNGKLRLDAQFGSVRSPAHLFAILVTQRCFNVAELFWHQSQYTNCRHSFTPSLLVSSIIDIPTNVSPREYCNLLETVVLPNLSINHEYLHCLRSWACQTADSFDEIVSASLGLDDAIHLLEAMERGTRALQLRVHASFASASPFVNLSVNRSIARITPPSTVNSTKVKPSIQSMNFLLTPSTLSLSQNPLEYDQRTVPTLLTMNPLLKGSVRVHPIQVHHSPKVDEYFYNFKCLRKKLGEAYCLRDARAIGLPRNVLSLKAVSEHGGSSYIASNLVALISDLDEANKSNFLCEKVAPLCHKFSQPFDEVISKYVECKIKEIAGSEMTESALKEFAIASRCCSSDLIKSKTALFILRAALKCGLSPPWLPNFSRDAITWASSDSGLKISVKDATRLLLIDGIVIKYCGFEARRIFKVSLRHHATRLLHYVTTHFRNDSVLHDVLALCGAYSHLSCLEAVCSITYRAMRNNMPELCSRIIETVNLRDNLLADQVLCGIVSFAEEVLKKSSSSLHAPTITQREMAIAVVECVLAVVSKLLEYKKELSKVAVLELSWITPTSSLESLKSLLQRLKRLQNDFSVYASLYDLNSPNFLVDIASYLLGPVVETRCNERSSFTSSKIAIAKKAFSLLDIDWMTGQNLADLWTCACADTAISIIRQNKDERITEFLWYIALFNPNQSNIESLALLSIVKALFLEASASIHDVLANGGMYRIVTAESLLQDHSLIGSCGEVLLASLSFGTVVGTACEIMSRCDEGIGEKLVDRRRRLQLQAWQQTRSQNNFDAQFEGFTFHKNIRRPDLHTSWYVGDGLLLPPHKSLTHSLNFCQNVLIGISSNIPLVAFLRHHGAHFLSIRVLSSMVMSFVSSRSTILKITKQRSDICSANSEAIRCLAERSLGGSRQVGLTSNIVDSELAASFLLSLPKKQAFRVYKDSIPSLKSRDFSRSFEIALIGVIASCEADRKSTEGFLRICWNRQNLLHDKCQNLAIQNLWWDKLQLLGISFDTRYFDTERKSSTNAKTAGVGNSYIVSLLPSIISKLYISRDMQVIMSWCTDFANTFDTPESVAIQAQIEWCLAPPRGVDGASRTCHDLDDKLATFVQSAVKLLKSYQQRLDILRRCIVTLESASSRFGTDYDRFTLALSLYREELLALSEQPHDNVSKSVKDVGFELETIDKRRDALEILKSYFHSKLVPLRPNFPSFFKPLPPNFSSAEVGDGAIICGVLGSEHSEGRTFDPLKSLEPLFAKATDNSIIAALRPMSFALGIPPGYIHARFLMTKFNFFSANSRTLPSVDNDVIPTIHEMTSPSDRFIFAEWCAKQYDGQDKDKLECLKAALHSAYMKTKEIEQRNPNSIEEDKALDDVKRLTTEKSSLEDILTVKTILRSSSPEFGQIAELVHQLMDAIEVFAQEHPQPQTETLVDFLVSKGSLLAARASLHPFLTLLTPQLKCFCTLVRDACKALSERNSHVYFDHHCKRLALQWLFHGDNHSTPLMQTPTPDSLRLRSNPKNIFLVDEDETTAFDIDLNNLQDAGNDYLAYESSPRTEPTSVTSGEETSALLPISDRELSEFDAYRSSIRIAFVLALSCDEESCEEHTDRENSTPITNKFTSIRSKRSMVVAKAEEDTDRESSTPITNQITSIRTKRSMVLAKMTTARGSQKDKQVLDYSRDLMSVVFARNTSSSFLHNSSSSNDGVGEIVIASFSSSPSINIRTFAMRHRAFRAASILCPQEALERIAVEETLLSDNCTLQECTFGSFIAKEIEEIGLPLPHSDLCLLSSMYFPSYARALMRDHRHARQLNCRGRFLLLLLEMSLKAEEIDTAFAELILDEMTQPPLPRTLLMAFERLRSCKSFFTDHSFDSARQVVLKAISTVSEAIFSELNRDYKDGLPNESDLRNIKATIERLGAVALSMQPYESGRFLDMCRKIRILLPSLKDDSLRECFQSILTQLAQNAKKYIALPSVDEDDTLSSTLRRLEDFMRFDADGSGFISK